ADITAQNNTTGTCQAVLWDTKQNTNSSYFEQLIPNDGRSMRILNAFKPFDALFLYSEKSASESLGKEVTFANIQLELGSTPTPYEPYQPGTTAQLSLPETIYGGTVDAV